MHVFSCPQDSQPSWSILQESYHFPFMFSNVCTYFSDICFKLFLRRTSWKCWDKNAIKGSLYIKSFIKFLIFICIPSFRNLVAVSLGFFHTWPHLISSHYTTFTQFLQSNAFAYLLSATLTKLWSDGHFLLGSLQQSSQQHFYFDILGHTFRIWLDPIIFVGLHFWQEFCLGLNFKMSEGVCAPNLNFLV